MLTDGNFVIYHFEYSVCMESYRMSITTSNYNFSWKFQKPLRRLHNKSLKPKINYSK